MKKLIAVLLAALMSLALFAVSASAAETETETKVVGGDNGVTDFTDTSSNGHDINVKVDAVTHKYAVDLTFNFADITIGNITWDVNNFVYVAEEPASADLTKTITVTNRSDLPVYAYAESTDADTSDAVTAEVDPAVTSDSRLKVDRTLAGATKGAEGTINVVVSSTNWSDTINYYAKKVTGDDTTVEKVNVSFKVATITVTISKSAS